MNKFLAACLLVLLAVLPAYAQSKKSVIQTEINTNLLDNTTGLITPLALRQVVTDILTTTYLGVGLTGNYTLQAADNGTTFNLVGPGVFFTVTLNAVGTYAAGFQVCLFNQDSRGKRVVITGGTPASLILFPTQVLCVFSVNAAWVPVLSGRWRLAAATTLFVDSGAGSDNNDCLAAGAGNACLTIQNAYNLVASSLDFGGKAVTLQVADGTYAAGLSVNQPWTGGGTFTMKGNSGTPTFVNLAITGTAVSVTAPLPGILTVKDMQLTGSVIGIDMEANGNLHFGNIVFGASVVHIECDTPGATVTADSNYTISGSAASHVEALGGSVNISNVQISASGALNFSQSFVEAQRLSFVQMQTVTFAGAGAALATGKRFNSVTNSLIFTNTAGSPTYFFPASAGMTAGTTGTQGLYQ